MTRFSLSVLAGTAALAAGLFAASVPANARCASPISCAQQPTGAIAKGGGIANRPGVGGANRPGMAPSMGAINANGMVAAGGLNFKR